MLELERPNGVFELPKEHIGELMGKSASGHAMQHVPQKERGWNLSQLECVPKVVIRVEI